MLYLLKNERIAFNIQGENMFIERNNLINKVNVALERTRIVALLGPRQCGKTTISKLIEKTRKDKVTYFDLENTEDAAVLTNPQMVLGSQKGTVIIDEIQRKPELFSVLRVLSDRKPLPAKFLILGSASPDIIRNVSDSLAGRVEFIEMNGFSLDEVGVENKDKLWLRGGLPESYLSGSLKNSYIWRENFIRTFIEKDVGQLGFQLQSTTVRRFWQMVAHVHGKVWNGAQLGVSLGVSHTTVRRYLDLLTGAFVLRQLQPWYENSKKRIVKSPKIYFRDTGLLHTFLRITDMRDLLSHPQLGFSWEGFVVEQLINIFGERDCFFWATHAGAEVDLLVVKGSKKYGFEIKFTETPKVTKSMKIALDDLNLTKLWIIYPGTKNISLDKKIHLLGIENLNNIFS